MKTQLFELMVEHDFPFPISVYPIPIDRNAEKVNGITVAPSQCCLCKEEKPVYVSGIVVSPSN